MQHTREEVAERLRVHVRTVDRYIRDGLLAAAKGPGEKGRVLISDTAINEYLAQRTVAPAGQPETAAR